MKKILLLLIIILLTSCAQTKIGISKKFYNEGKYIKIKAKDLDKYKDDNYVLFTYNSYCNFSVPCEFVFENVMKKHKIDFLSIKVDEFKKTHLHKTVKYAPSIVIVQKKKVIAYLDSNKDEDIKRYENEKEFEKWLFKYIK